MGSFHTRHYYFHKNIYSVTFRLTSFVAFIQSWLDNGMAHYNTWWNAAIINAACVLVQQSNVKKKKGAVFLLSCVFSTTCFRQHLKVKYHSLHKKHFICQIAMQQPIPLLQLLFALTAHSHRMTSSLLLIRFAIFRALDIYSAKSVNTVFLLQPSLV